MKTMEKLVTGAVIIAALSTQAFAGMYAVTTHSRANCAGFNESITWYGQGSYDWRVESHHFQSKFNGVPNHVINTGKMYTWRAAAVHTNEAFSSHGDKWHVVGYHFYYPYGRETLNDVTIVDDCSIYDGWWG